MAKYNVTNRRQGLRSFTGGGRFLKLTTGETEKDVELSKEEKDALDATGDFIIREIKSEKAPRVSSSGETARRLELPKT